MADVTSKVCDYRVDPDTGERCGRPVPGDRSTTVRLDNVPTDQGPNGVLSFEIDLCVEADHRQALLDALRPFMQSTDRIQVKVAERLRGAFLGTGSDVVTTRLARTWWKENQERVKAQYKDTGPLPKEVSRAYVAWQQEQASKNQADKN